jgi:hypothetical protein
MFVGLLAIGISAVVVVGMKIAEVDRDAAKR